MSISIYFLFLKKKKKKKYIQTNKRTWVLFVRVVLTQGADRLWVVSCGVTRVVLLTFPRTQENRREARIHSPLPPAHCFALTTTPTYPLSFSLNLSLWKLRNNASKSLEIEGSTCRETHSWSILISPQDWNRTLPLLIHFQIHYSLSLCLVSQKTYHFCWYLY